MPPVQAIPAVDGATSSSGDERAPNRALALFTRDSRCRTSRHGTDRFTPLTHAPRELAWGIQSEPGPHINMLIYPGISKLILEPRSPPGTSSDSSGTGRLLSAL